MADPTFDPNFPTGGKPLDIAGALAGARQTVEDIINQGGLWGIYTRSAREDVGLLDKADAGLKHDWEITSTYAADLAQKTGHGISEILLGRGPLTPEVAATIPAPLKMPPPVEPGVATPPSTSSFSAFGDLLKNGLGGGGGTFTFPGPDFSTSPGPPPEAPLPTPPDTKYQEEVLKVLEGLAPSEPEPRPDWGPGGTWTNILGGAAESMSRIPATKGNLGKMILAMGAGMAGAAEEARRYDADQREDYERRVREYEIYRLGIKDNFQLREQQYKDAVAQTKYENTKAQYMYNYDVWEKQQAGPPTMSGGYIFHTELGADGQYHAKLIDPNPMDEVMQMMLLQIKAQEAFGSTKIEALNAAGEMKALETLAPWQRPIAMVATEIFSGSLAPQLKDHMTQKVWAEEIRFRATKSGINLEDKDAVAGLEMELIREFEGKDWRELAKGTLGKRILEEIRTYLITNPEAMKQFGPIVPGVGLQGYNLQ